MCFNNFSADAPFPCWLIWPTACGAWRTEFSPSPQETLRLVGSALRQPRNLLLRFSATSSPLTRAAG